MKIKGKVINQQGGNEAFAKVFVSNRDGIVTGLKLGTVTDENGNFTLDVTNRDGMYLTASIVGAKTTSIINDEIKDYLLDLGTDRNTQIQEVTVIGTKKPTGVLPKTEFQQLTKAKTKKTYFWVPPSVIGVLLISTGIYYAIKKK